MPFIIELADTVEAHYGTGAIFALRLDDCSLEERQLIIDSHGAVMRELRARGHRVRAGIVHDELDGETITLRIAAGPGWR